MRSADVLYPAENPNSVSETHETPQIGQARPSLVEELDQQLAFRQFLKQHIPTRKASPEFIQSLKDRIKVVDITTEQ